MTRRNPAEFLILSASTGNGHISAANAIEQEMLSRGVRATHEDTLLWTPKGWKLWYGNGYEFTVRNIPKFWGMLYRVSDAKQNWQFRLQTKLDMFFCQKIDQLVEETNPRWVVCTHSLPQPRLAMLREKRPGMRMAVVVTDLKPHGMWLRGEPDWFFVPTEWSAEQLEMRMPGARAKTTVCGIPVNAAFNDERPKADIRKALRLPADMPIILLTAGGIGAGPIVPMLKKFAKEAEKPIFVVTVCGRNKKTFATTKMQAKLITSGSKMKVRVLGHVKPTEMAALMNACDLMVGKPGGLTTSEALVAGCPMVVADPFVIPGQEEDNRDFLVEKGIGVRAGTLEQVAETALELVADPARLAEMSRRAKENGHPGSAAIITQKLLELG
jgi:processive 1,2-diacylglycerol beta-glucosyltransferase